MAIEYNRVRVYHYYVPVYTWVKHELKKHSEKKSGKPFFLGMSAPQGCGKTTLVMLFEHLLSAEGHKSVVLSIDDFYLRGADQDALAQKFATNGLLKYRGNAGSHDLELVRATLDKCSSLKENETMSLPFYDKSLREGRGDRAPESEWKKVSGPLDVVMVEGWMFGFKAVAEDSPVLKEIPDLAEVNKILKQYVFWHGAMDCWLVLRMTDTNGSAVLKWRLEQEHKMKENGKPGLTDEQVKDFVDRFIPAYKAFLPGLYASGPEGAENGKKDTLQVLVGPSREPLLDLGLAGA